MSAVISDCGRYRYRLERDITGRRGLTALVGAVIMVNPSTAGPVEDDATIRKLRGFSRAFGWDRLIVGNLFAYRATDVRELGKVDHPVGLDNDEHLHRIMREADEVVFAWGPVAKQPKRWRGRFKQVLEIAANTRTEPKSIGPVAKCGHPKHPLMLPYSLTLQPWSPPA